MHHRFAAGDRDHGRSALIDRFEAGFGREICLQDVGRVLNLAASGASQIAAEQRLEHEHERIALASGEFLAQNVRSHGPHLGYGNCHCPSGEECLSMIPDSMRDLSTWAYLSDDTDVGRGAVTKEPAPDLRLRGTCVVQGFAVLLLRGWWMERAHPAAQNSAGLVPLISK